MAINARTFDVFGTVVDWRTAIIEEMSALGAANGVDGDWAAFTDEWKSHCTPSLRAVNAGRRPWTNVDKLFRDELDPLLTKHGLAMLAEDERNHLNRAWCRPRAWPDSVAGLTRLRSKFTLSTLSNGNFAWLVAIAKHCSLPFDCALTAENARAYSGIPADDGHVEKSVIKAAVVATGMSKKTIVLTCHNGIHLARISSKSMSKRSKSWRQRVAWISVGGRKLSS